MIFAVPFQPFTIDNPSVDKEITEYINRLDNVDSLGNVWGDQLNSTFNVISGPRCETKYVSEFSSLNTIVKAAASDLYEKSTGKPWVKFRVTSSFVNFYSKGHYQSWHHHYDDDISAVYFFQCNKDTGSLIFKNPNPLCDYLDSTMQYRFFEHYALPKHCVIFPSWLAHKVEVNNTNLTRITVALNLKIENGV